MTGYLHIPDGDELLEQLAVAAHDWEHPDCWHPEGRLSDCYMFAHSVLTVLRGLSVEPTERSGREIQRCLDFSQALMGVMPELDDPADAELVTQRAMQWEQEADRLITLGAPVPVQEDHQ